MLFTSLSVPFVASNTLASLSNPSTNVRMDTEVTLQKRHFFLWASTPDCLTTVSRISTEWKSSSLNRTVCGVIFKVRIGKDFGLKNSVFYIRTVLTENNKFLCIFSFTVFIVNEYFTTVTKLKICAHHLLLVSCNYTILSLQTQSNFDRHWGRSFVDRKFCQYIFCNIFIGIVAQSSRLL